MVLSQHFPKECAIFSNKLNATQQVNQEMARIRIFRSHQPIYVVFILFKQMNGEWVC